MIIVVVVIIIIIIIIITIIVMAVYSKITWARRLDVAGFSV